MKSARFYDLESSHEDSNSYEFFKLLWTHDIFRLALLFAIVFFFRIVIISSMRKYAINVL